MSQAGGDPVAFAAQFGEFLSWVRSGAPGGGDGVSALLRRHLGEAGAATPVVSREWPGYEQVNLQVAVEAWAGAPGRDAEVVGLGLAGGGPVDLVDLLAGVPGARRTTPALVDLPSGPGTTVGCWRIALLLVTDRRGRFAVLVRGPVPGVQPGVVVELVGLPAAVSQEVVAELADLRATLDAHRGQVLRFATGTGGASLTFAEVPAPRREDVVLPDGVLERIERHCVLTPARRRALRATRQHLRRGVLLHGPPGTGKSHTARYVVGRMAGATVVMLAGTSLHGLREAVALARDLQPAVVVLEDVDMIAEERGRGPHADPLLFDLLDAMDGAGPDADVLFLLTTNRVELLEPALALRPGRVDVSVEVGLPGPDARRRLLALYARSVPLAMGSSDVDEVVERTRGVTASFMRELVRRCVLEALDADGEPLRAVRAAHVHRAIDDLLATSRVIPPPPLAVPPPDGLATGDRPPALTALALP